MSMSKIVGVSACAVLVLTAIPRHAMGFNITNVEIWAGAGTNEAVLVVHWSAPETNSVSTMPAPIDDVEGVWGYRYNGVATAQEMMLAIAATDTNLYILASGATNYGVAIYGIGYDLNHDGQFRLTNAVDGILLTESSFTNGWLGNLPYVAADRYEPVGTNDLYWGGWYGPNWELWHEYEGNGGFENAPIRGEDTYWTDTSGWGFWGYHGEWDFSEYGISGITLKDKSWVGWSVSAAPLIMDDWDGPESMLWREHKQAPADLD